MEAQRFHPINPCSNRDHVFANELNGIQYDWPEKGDGTKTSSPPGLLVQVELPDSQRRGSRSW
jgi:hypothetical protein